MGVYNMVFLFQTGSRKDRTDLIKELDRICVMAHQCKAPIGTTELLGFEPATVGSAA